MGKRGPRKEATEIKLIKGTYRKHRDGDPNSLPVTKLQAGEVPEAPKNLNEYGQSIWYSVIDEYSRLSIFAKALDLPMFEKYCWTMQKVKELEQALEKEGFLSQGAYSEVRNPKFDVYSKLMSQAMQISKEYGFTPQSRQNLRLNEEKIVKDPLQKFDEL